MTNFELAVALSRLGAQVAFGLGSGASAAMAFDGDLLTRPSSGEQPIADALLLTYTGVYAAQPSADVVSPNGDGVDDTETFTVKVVRASHLTATVTGPNKIPITLAQADEQPGTYTFPWDPKGVAEGNWTFSVSDGSTTATRDFSVNNTLASVAVSGTDVSFQLARPADVAITIQNGSGVTVATVLVKKLGAGAQQATWTGKPRSGYRVHVVATNTIGAVAVTVPFGSRKR
jgi:flagellar hook assembly protein FlgD